MKFGLNTEQYEFILKNAIEPMNLNHHESIYCYGSRARGDNSLFYDLDLMVESSQDHSTKISSIKELLSKSNFPFKVDLVQLKDFANSYKPNYENEKAPY